MGAVGAVDVRIANVVPGPLMRVLHHPAPTAMEPRVPRV